MRFAPRQISNEPARASSRALHACYNSQTVGKRVTIGVKERERALRDSYAVTIPSQGECIVPLRECARFPRYHFHTTGDSRHTCKRRTDACSRFSLRSIESKLRGGGGRRKSTFTRRVNNFVSKMLTRVIRKPKPLRSKEKTTIGPSAQKNPKWKIIRRNESNRIRVPLQSQKWYSSDANNPSKSLPLLPSISSRVFVLIFLGTLKGARTHVERTHR